MINSYARGVPLDAADLVNVVPPVEYEPVPTSPVASAAPSYHIAELEPFAKAVNSCRWLNVTAFVPVSVVGLANRI